MQWLDRLEPRFRNWTIPQFPLFIVAASGLIYLLGITEPTLYERLSLDSQAIRAGQWWRLITFLFIPPFGGIFGNSGLTPIWIVFWLLLLYQYASALEYRWGDFHFQVYYAIGAIATLAAGLLFNVSISNAWLHTTLFLTFATLFPEVELLLFFVIPVRIKYLAGFTWLILMWQLVAGGLQTRLGICAALINFSIFLGPSIYQSIRLRLRQRN